MLSSINTLKNHNLQIFFVNVSRVLFMPMCLHLEKFIYPPYTPTNLSDVTPRGAVTVEQKKNLFSCKHRRAPVCRRLADVYFCSKLWKQGPNVEKYSGGTSQGSHPYICFRCMIQLQRPPNKLGIHTSGWSDASTYCWKHLTGQGTFCTLSVTNVS